MKLTKIALATSLAVAASSTFALEAMDESTMGSVTGQDGISVTLSNVDTTADIAIFDRDGIQGTANANEGAIVLDNMNLSADQIALVIDAGTVDAADTAATLRVGVDVDNLSLTTGDIQVATVDGAGSFATANAETIINSTTIELADLQIDVTLGDTSDGTNMIEFGTLNIAEVNLAGFALNDSDGTTGSNGGALGAENIKLVDLNLGGTTIDVTDSGLVIGTPASALGAIEITNLYAGSFVDDASTSILGDVGISNINTGASTITISGR